MIDDIHISVLNKYINPDITPGNLCVFSNFSVFLREISIFFKGNVHTPVETKTKCILNMFGSIKEI